MPPQMKGDIQFGAGGSREVDDTFIGGTLQCT